MIWNPQAGETWQDRDGVKWEFRLNDRGKLESRLFDGAQSTAWAEWTTANARAAVACGPFTRVLTGRASLTGNLLTDRVPTKRWDG